MEAQITQRYETRSALYRMPTAQHADKVAIAPNPLCVDHRIVNDVARAAFGSTEPLEGLHKYCTRPRLALIIYAALLFIRCTTFGNARKLKYRNVLIGPGIVDWAILTSRAGQLKLDLRF